MSQGRLSRSLVITGQTRGDTQPEDTMSTYIDPATALTIARQARAEQMGRAEQYHQTVSHMGTMFPLTDPGLAVGGT